MSMFTFVPNYFYDSDLLITEIKVLRIMASSCVSWTLIGNFLAPSTSSYSREGYAFKLPTNPGMRTVTCQGSRLSVVGTGSAKSHGKHYIWILTTITIFYKLQTSGVSSPFVNCPQLIFCPHKRDTWSSRILREKQGALSHRISTEEGALSHRVSTEDLLRVGTVKVGYNQSISVKVLDWGEG